MPVDFPRDTPLDLVLDGATDGLGRLGGLPVPQGTPGAVVDDFEDQDLAEYQGDTGNFQFTTSPVQSGTYALEKPPGGTYDIVSTSGLPRYPAPGDTFEWYWYCTQPDTTDQRAFFGVQNSPTNMDDADADGYEVVPYAQGDEFRLWRRDGGSVTVLASTAQTNWPSGEWARMQVSWTTGGDITAKMFDASDTELVSVSATDTTYGKGGIAMRLSSASSDPPVYMDNWRVTGDA